MKGILDEPPCRASMKNSSNKRMIERKGSWKHKVKPCDDLEGASQRYNRENLELRKRKDETLEPRITSSWTISGRKELNHLEEIKIRFIVCVSFTNFDWWQAMDLAYCLFLKNSSNKRMIERKGSWKHKVKPCDDLEGASQRYNRENLELRKRKDETLEPRITSSWTISGRKELNHLEEIKIRFIVCVSFTNFDWWQAMDLAYCLFSVEMIKESFTN